MDGLFDNLNVIETSMVDIGAGRCQGVLGPTNAYLGVQGDTDHDGNASLDIVGNEIGVLGVSLGSSVSDNYGLFGHSNGFGGCFEYSDGTTVSNHVEIAGADASLTTFGTNGIINVELGQNGADNGRISVYDDGLLRINLFTESLDTGAGLFYGPGSSNILVGYLTGFTNHGYVEVRDGNSSGQAGMYVDSSGNGIVFGDTKSFRIDHPQDESKEIWYACVEGPEAAAYVRGTATLLNGHATITFPEYFAMIINEATMTINLTPTSAASKGLAVTSKSATEFEVQELMNGDGTYQFDWVATAVRKGHEGFQPMRDKRELATIQAEPQRRAAPADFKDEGEE